MLICAGTLYAQNEPAAIRPRLPPRDSLFDSTFVAQQGQDSAGAHRPAQPNCWRAQRKPPCASFFLTELSVEMPVISTHRDDPLSDRPNRADYITRIALTFGVMGNQGANAYGVAWSLTSDDFESAVPFVLEGRYKRWFGSATVDAGLGYKNSNIWQNGRGYVRAGGVTAMAGYTPNRFIGLRGRADVVHGGGRTARTLFVGATSSWLSEQFLRLMAIGILRELLGAIGIHIGDEEE